MVILVSDIAIERAKTLPVEVENRMVAKIVWLQHITSGE